MKTILFLFLPFILQSQTTAPDYWLSYECIKSDSISHDTTYFNGDIQLCQNSHKWAYNEAGSPIPTQSTICKDSILEYERICETCLRHEYKLFIQTYRQVKHRQTKFQRLKNKINNNN